MPSRRPASRPRQQPLIEENALVNEAAEEFVNSCEPEEFRKHDKFTLIFLRAVMLQATRSVLLPDFPSLPIEINAPPVSALSRLELKDNFWKNNLAHFVIVDPESGERKVHISPISPAAREYQDAVKKAAKRVSPKEFLALYLSIWVKLTKHLGLDDLPEDVHDHLAWLKAHEPGGTLAEDTIGIPYLTLHLAWLKAHGIQPPDEQQHDEARMPRDENITIKPDGTLLKDGIPYRAVAEAAPEAQAHRTTLLRWIKDDPELEGGPLESYYLAPARKHFISEKSIQRLANRFVKWDGEHGQPAGPAGHVTLGETKDKSGFLGMWEAADIVGVSKRTMWLWASHGNAPIGKPLDVIKCPASNHFYVREKDVYDLKKLIPRSGLQRGRRHLEPQPS
jgi:hypothetical protein